MKLKRTYSYALWSAFYLTILTVAIATLSYYFMIAYLGIISVALAVIALFIISFFIIQYRAEHFIYRRLRKIYEEVSVLDVNDLKSDSVTTDIEKLSKK